MPTDVPPPTTSDDPGADPPVGRNTDPDPGPGAGGYPGRAPRVASSRGRLGPPGVLVITLGSVALGLWLLVVSSSAGLPAAVLHLLAGVVAVALLAVLATLALQIRRLARELSGPIAHDGPGAPEDQEPHL